MPQDKTMPQLDPAVGLASTDIAWVTQDPNGVALAAKATLADIVAAAAPGAGGSVTSVDETVNPGGPNGVVTAKGPSVCIGTLGHVWGKTSPVNDNLSWFQLI